MTLLYDSGVDHERASAGLSVLIVFVLSLLSWGILGAFGLGVWAAL